MKEYDQTFRDQLHHGIIERVEETQEQLLGQTHCMPHYAVIRGNTLTTKLRVVFDASPKVKPNCPSLNDCTLMSPPLTNISSMDRLSYWTLDVIGHSPWGFTGPILQFLFPYWVRSDVSLYTAPQAAAISPF